MYDKIDPADYARLMNAATRRSHALRRAAERGFFLRAGRAARRVLQTMKRVLQARTCSARQFHQKGA